MAQNLTLEESSLIFIIPRRIKHSIVSKVKKIENLPLNNTQIMTLMVLSDEEPVCMNQLGKLIGMDKGSFTQVIDKLVKKHYTKRERDPEDRRSVKVMLTEKGLEFTDRIKKQTYEELKNIFSVLEKDELDLFIESFKNIDKIIKKIEEN